MQFDWDENKSKLNIEQHGLDFKFAKQIFNNDLLVVPDLRVDYQ